MTRWALRLLFTFCVLHGAAAWAFDKVFHHTLIYTIAMANGFSADDAALMADGSQSLDENESTLAYKDSLVIGEIRQGSLAPHMRSGQIFHALTTWRNRETIEKAHIERIRRVASDPNTSEERRRRSLLYFGQYLHFVADMAVHPYDPLFGHADDGHLPDRTDQAPDKTRAAVALMHEKMKAFSSDGLSGRLLEPTHVRDLKRQPEVLDQRRSVNDLLEAATRAATTSWTMTPEGRRRAVRWYESAGDAAKAIDYYAEERSAAIEKQIVSVLREHGKEYRPFQKYELDSNGEATGICGRGGCSAEAAQSAFGTRRSIEHLPFGMQADRRELSVERDLAVSVAIVRGGAVAANVAEAVKETASWVPPSSPGGVALNPRLRMPTGNIGMAKRINYSGDEVYLETASERLRIEGVSARSFATIARAVAVGEIPFVTIGSDASARPGYARVTYNPALEGTVEALQLYQADLQFKRIFAKLPMKDVDAAETINDLFIARFPGLGGEFTRFWITSSDIELARDGDRLVSRAHGMRILSETKLRYAVRTDDEMEEYAAELSKKWDVIAHAVPEFRGVEVLARTTALVFWAREKGIEIAPSLLLLPPRRAITPGYAPLVVHLAGGMSIAGGVALTPEDKRTTAGRQFLTVLTRGMTKTFSSEFASRAAAAGLGLLFLLVPVACAAMYWWLVNTATQGQGTRVSFRRALGFWFALCGIQIVLVLVLWPLLFEDLLSLYDRNLLALIATIVAFPILLFLSIDRVAARGTARMLGRGWRYLLLALGIAGPISAGMIGVGLACLSVAITGFVPSQPLNALLTAQMAPAEALTAGILTVSTTPAGKRNVLPGPHSLHETQRPNFSLPRAYKSDGMTEINSTGAGSPTMPWTRLLRVRWSLQGERPGADQHYTIDGRPPL